MLTRLLVGAGVVTGGILAYNWWQKKQDEKGKVLQAVGLVPKGRPGAKRIVKVPGVRPGAKKAPKILGPRPGVKRIVTRTVRGTPAPRPGVSAIFTRPATLSECCDNLCLPLHRETRPSVPLERGISANRNLWEDYYC